MSIKNWLIKKLGGYTSDEHDQWINLYSVLTRKNEELRKNVHRLNYEMLEKWMREFKLETQRHDRCFALVKDAPADTKLPTRKTKGSAGYDFYLPCDVVLEPYGDSPIIQTGVKAYMPEDEVLLLFIRSSVGIMKNVTLSNSVGVIDASYCDNPDNEGNIGLKLHNNSPHTVTFKKGERIMQGVFVKYGVVDDDNATEERKGGIGSTGKE